MCHLFSHLVRYYQHPPFVQEPQVSPQTSWEQKIRMIDTQGTHNWWLNKQVCGFSMQNIISAHHGVKHVPEAEEWRALSPAHLGYGKMERGVLFLTKTTFISVCQKKTRNAECNHHFCDLLECVCVCVCTFALIHDDGVITHTMLSDQCFKVVQHSRPHIHSSTWRRQKKTELPLHRLIHTLSEKQHIQQLNIDRFKNHHSL